MNINEYTLSKGSHGTFEDGICALELAAHLAGEPHSDSPECTSPAIAAYVRNLQDRMSDDDRNRLILPLVPSLLGTSGVDEQALAFMCVDRAVRVFASTALRASGIGSLRAHADTLEQLPKIDTAAAYAAAADAADAAAAAAAADAADAAARAADAAAYAAAAAAAAAADAADADAAAAAAVYAAADAADAAAYARAAGAWEPAIQLLKDMVELAKGVG